MAQPNHNAKSKKQLAAPEVYTLVQQVIQEQWALNMEERDYEAQDIWDVVIAAAVEQLSLQEACDLLANAPSGNTVRGILKDMLNSAGAARPGSADEYGVAAPLAEETAAPTLASRD